MRSENVRSVFVSPLDFLHFAPAAQVVALFVEREAF
jgi:hypothetical protein